MAVAIDNFINLDKPNKILFLGDMFELGTESRQEHKEIVSMLSETKNTICYFIGKYFYANQTNRPNFKFYQTFEDLAADLKQTKFINQMMLIKGSRGMALERILELL